MMSSQEIDILVKLLVAAFLGGIIGIERERDKRPAGLRTHILVCVSVTMFAVIPIYYFKDTPAEVSRVWQNVLTGIGFLVAGVVIKEEHGVHGLTTAAGLWAVSALGLAVGAGMYFLAGVGTVLVLLTLNVLRRFEHHFAPMPPDEIPRKQ